MLTAIPFYLFFRLKVNFLSNFYCLNQKCMRNLTFLLLLLPVLTWTQDFAGWDIQKIGDLDRIVHVSEQEAGHLIYLVSPLSLEISGVSARGTKTNIDLMRIFKLDEKAELIDQFILHKSAFDGKSNLKFKSYANTYGESEDIRTYEQLVAEYPDLAAVDRITSYCKKRPIQKYESSLNTALFKPRIIGFTASQMTLGGSATNDNSEKKGLGKLVSKLEQSNNGYSSNQQAYAETGSIDLDWKDSYNGSPDKKNFWKNFSQASCPATGKVIAVNGHKLKKEDNSEYLINEIVVIGPDGQLISREELNNDVARPNSISKGRYDQVDNNLELKGLSMANWQFIKVKNHNSNRHEVRLLEANASGKVVGDEVFSLPYNVKNIDKIIHVQDQTILVGSGMKDTEEFILIASSAGQSVIEVPAPEETSYIGFQKFSPREGGGGIFMYHNEGDNSGRDLYIYELDSSGDLAGPFMIQTKKSAFDELSDQFDIFHNGENESYLSLIHI